MAKEKCFDIIADIESYFERLKTTINHIDRDDIRVLIELLGDAYQLDRNVFICGNGGSAATASHFAGDFNKGVSYPLKKRFKVFSLTDNIPVLTAYANDVSYEDVFVEQIKNFLNPGDIVIGISGSGNSKNVLKAIEYANQSSAITVGITGFDGGVLKRISHYGIHAEIDDMQIVEDIHMILTHLTSQLLKEYCLSEQIMKVLQAKSSSLMEVASTKS